MIFETTLDVLVSHGIPNALEICNEIDAILNRQPLKKLNGDELLQIALNCVVGQYPEYPVAKRIKQDWKTGATEFVTVIESHPITIEAIRSRSRKAELVNARHILRYLLNKHTPLSLLYISHLMGNSEHSVVIYGTDMVNDLKSYDKEYSRKLSIIENDFKRKIGKYE
jgi:hypothetical protein